MVRPANVMAHCLYQYLGFIDIEDYDRIQMSLEAADYSAPLQDG